MQRAENHIMMKAATIDAAAAASCLDIPCCCSGGLRAIVIVNFNIDCQISFLKNGNMRSINTGSQNLSIGTYLYHRNLVCPSQIGHQRMQHTSLGRRPTQAEAVVYLCEPSERHGLHILLRDFLGRPAAGQLE